MIRRIVIALGLSLALAAGTASAAGGWELSWWTVDGGGEQSGQNGYVLNGTIGQPDAGEMSGGSYTLRGGYWAGNAPQYRANLPTVRK